MIALVVLAGTFLAGYSVGVRHGDRGDPSAYRQVISSQWVKEGVPPLPTVSIQGVAVEVARGSYTWCSPLLSSEGSCVSVDASIPELKAAVVPAGAKVDAKAPEGIKEFTISKTNQGAGDDPYFVPQKKGKYLYQIHCEWFLDQGQSDYFFAVEVV